MFDFAVPMHTCAENIFCRPADERDAEDHSSARFQAAGAFDESPLKFRNVFKNVEGKNEIKGRVRKSERGQRFVANTIVSFRPEWNFPPEVFATDDLRKPRPQMLIKRRDLFREIDRRSVRWPALFFEKVYRGSHPRVQEAFLAEGSFAEVGN